MALRENKNQEIYEKIKDEVIKKENIKKVMQKN